MEVFEAVQVRKSIRAYYPKPIPREVLMKILESARISPSADNAQPWHFIVVTDSEKRKVFSRERWAKFLTESPMVIVGCGDKRRSPKWNIIDVTIAMQTMVLTATAEGIGTCWIGSFDEDNVRRLCKIPKNLNVICLLALGYPREKRKRRKAMAEIVSFEEFGKKE